MAGPHTPNPTVGTDGPPPYTDAAFATTQSAIHVDDATPAYPGMLPPPVSYPRRRPKRLIISVLVAIALVAAMTAAIVYGVRTNGSKTGGTFSETTAKTAIQGYLDALEQRDVDTIARNALCGIYDAVRDRRPDQALARLSSDAFRKQFSEVELTSIDKIVYWSPYQAQVLFTMRASPATGGPMRGQLQGVAQLLYQRSQARSQVLVCSYMLRTAGSR
ncbi:Rv0361 family membrane protein [Mycobacterium haemophilum]|uniref:DUF8174 domain-containing protein n=1 Tax=Mycobacterium haemophilum TaxID=29311 RepID=A0A0I9UJZ4_9MYCO|nr:hypothetical protein [Mycobacterium haemophilum]AKN16831.1 hypothetical protein B586_10150 [Mycobacterium haemophilum DSM 44634]KLO32037.1 hypothetical protein ABH39_08645 [Mycobacterium haemophilum]KLO36388.1 hypothetical protein ABH38_12565 [Mycobacterium haemophilum]KLO42273.1 hypothetical protein ABH37_11195 [Mycobacterium haemophilum]KLO50074.1 hypothetical protein ABH36_09115 [Mycobacterium haemophilum]